MMHVDVEQAGWGACGRGWPSCTCHRRQPCPRLPQPIPPLCSFKNYLFSPWVSRYAFKIHVVVAGLVRRCLGSRPAAPLLQACCALPCVPACLLPVPRHPLQPPPPRAPPPQQVVLVLSVATILFGLGMLVVTLQLVTELLCSEVANVSVDGVRLSNICIQLPSVNDGQPMCGYDALQICYDVRALYRERLPPAALPAGQLRRPGALSTLPPIQPARDPHLPLALNASCPAPLLPCSPAALLQITGMGVLTLVLGAMLLLWSHIIWCAPSSAGVAK